MGATPVSMAGASMQNREKYPDYGAVHQPLMDQMPSHTAIASQKAH